MVVYCSDGGGAWWWCIVVVHCSGGGALWWWCMVVVVPDGGGSWWWWCLLVVVLHCGSGGGSNTKYSAEVVAHAGAWFALIFRYITIENRVCEGVVSEVNSSTLFLQRGLTRLVNIQSHRRSQLGSSPKYDTIKGLTRTILEICVRGLPKDA